MARMTKQTKANWLTVGIVSVLSAFGAVCHWKPAYGLIIGISVAFTLTAQAIRASLLETLNTANNATRNPNERS